MLQSMLSVVLVMVVFLPAGFSSISDSGKTYHHDFVVGSTSYTRLCRTKDILTVNGKFPGPTLSAHRGDTLVVRVYNKAKHNITIHWHGVKQYGNPWSDGAAYITQCPIQPGRDFTYEVKFSSEEGTLWWHAHDQGARATVHGAIVVYPRRHLTYPFAKPDHQMPIVLGEWWNKDVLEIYGRAGKMGGDPQHSDAYTINGKPGYLYPCSKSETFKMAVEQGKRYLLRIINAAMDEQLFFAIARHRMTLVGIDGSYTKPLPTDHIMISPGQTMDVLLEANQPPGQYVMAASAYDNGMGSMGDMKQMDSMGSMGPMPEKTITTAYFQYSGSSCKLPSSPIFPSLPAYNDSHAANNFTSHLAGLAANIHQIKIPKKVDEHLFFVLSQNLGDCGGHMTCDGMMGMRNLASINNISFVQPSVDILQAYFYELQGVYDDDFPGEPMIKFNYTGHSMDDMQSAPQSATKVKVLEVDSAVEIIFQGTSLVSGESHPMHLHGHSFYVVGWGFGNFDPEKDPLRYNLVNPPEMSTLAVPKNGWATIRFIADNPGVWMLHCHFQHHQMAGMSMALIVKSTVQRHSLGLGRPPANMPGC
ncbi:laccase-14-like [Typha latifolia]|uniref:laccase-14-like n=1 Tax=Typha latifolia TaxID=4733 RepID=UPI003C2F1A02